MTSNKAGQERARLSGRTGAVLLIIVFLVAFSALLVGGLLHALTSDLQILNNHLTSTKALYVADAGVEDVIAALRADHGWDAGFTQKQFPAGSGSHYTVTVDNDPPIVVITSTGVVSGFQRRVEAQVFVLRTSAPHPIRVVYWKEL